MDVCQHPHTIHADGMWIEVMMWYLLPWCSYRI